MDKTADTETALGSSECYECWRCGYRASMLTPVEAVEARVRHLGLCPQRP